MENKPKLEPLKLAEWAQNSAFFAKGVELISETKRSKQSDSESNPKVRFNPIPPSQLRLCFQALKSSGIGQTPVRPVTSIKKKNWNSSVNIVSKERSMTEIKSKAKATNTWKTVVEKATPPLQTFKTSKVKKEGSVLNNEKVRFNPIPPSQLLLCFQALKSSGIGQTPVRPVTSIKKKNWNSSVNIVSKERSMTEIKSKAKATNTWKTVVEKATPPLQTFKTSKVKKEGSVLNNEIMLSGIKRIPITPQRKEIVPNKLQINTPKSILKKKVIQNTPLSTTFQKSYDGDATFLRIEKEVDALVQEKEIENDVNINVALPSSTPFKASNVLENFPTSDADFLQKDKTILDISNVSENENPVVALCDAFQKALISHACPKTDLKQERGSLISVIGVALKHIQEIEEYEKENAVNNSRKQVMGISSTDFCRTTLPKFKIQKKIVFQNSPKKCHVSPKVHKDALNVYMGLKRNLNFLNTPKIDKTQNNETDTPLRVKKNLRFQLNRLYNDSES